MKGTLRSAAEFSRVMRKGNIVTTPDVVIHTLRTSDGSPGRYGMVVAKKGRNAVERNRCRRQIRAAVMLAGGFGEDVDGVVRLLGARKVHVEALRVEICQILARAGYR